MQQLVSNPPFNMKWRVPEYAGLDMRFMGIGIPPKTNANFAFILTALSKAERSIFILPTGCLTASTKEERQIIQYLVNNNIIETIIALPDKMFESTNVATCILIINRNKTTATINMIDARKIAEKEVREQRGQFGGKSHTNRVYKKEFNILTDEAIEKITSLDNEITRKVSLEDVKKQDYKLQPSLYFEIKLDEEDNTRSYEDIVKDINNIRTQRNTLKLTINRTLADRLDVGILDQKPIEFDELEELLDVKFVKDDYISFTKNKNELVFKNNSDTNISHILLMIMKSYTEFIYFMNNQENIYLAELRDKLLPELMSGKLKVDGAEENNTQEETKKRMV